MPLEVRNPATEIVSESLEIDSVLFVRVIRYRRPSSISKTQAPPFLNAIIWGESGLKAVVDFSSRVISKLLFKRDNVTVINSQATEAKVALFPQSPFPTGSVLYQGESLDGKTFCKGSNVPVLLIISGYQLDGLMATLTFNDLSEKVTFSKQIKLSAGSPQILSKTDNADGSESYTGEVMLSPYNTRLEGVGSPIELSYELKVHNNFSRYYCLENGRVNFD